MQTLDLRLRTAELHLIAIDRSLEAQSERFNNFVDYVKRQADQRADSIKAGIDTISDHLDGYAKQVETGDQERLMLGKQLDDLNGRVTTLESAA